MQVCNIDFLVIVSKEHIIKSGYFGMRVWDQGQQILIKWKHDGCYQMFNFQMQYQ